jgi:diadenosine tetraphosphate (Ap4A) HIT family hydrolase
MSTLIHERVELARRGQNPTVIARLASGWAVLGDQQFPLGYCLLLPDPVVPTLNDLDTEQRARFLLDMAALGDAILESTTAYRINYEIQGNGDRALHAHLFARYSDEDPEYVRGPVWRYDAALRSAAGFDLGRHGALREALASALARAGVTRPRTSL